MVFPSLPHDVMDLSNIDYLFEIEGFKLAVGISTSRPTDPPPLPRGRRTELPTQAVAERQGRLARVEDNAAAEPIAKPISCVDQAGEVAGAHRCARPISTPAISPEGASMITSISRLPSR